MTSPTEYTDMYKDRQVTRCGCCFGLEGRGKSIICFLIKRLLSGNSPDKLSYLVFISVL